MGRKNFYLIILLSLLINFFVLSSSIAIEFRSDQSSFRCSGGVVSVGDYDRDVLDKCGEPIDTARRLSDSYDYWIYHFGASRFMYYFGFLHGKLQRIVSAPCQPDVPGCYDLR
jgi:hypothetical protein